MVDAAQDLNDFYADSYSRLVGVLAATCGDQSEAEEVVQEAFIRLIPRWRTVSTYDDPESWVRLVAFRLLSNRFRRVRRTLQARPGVTAQEVKNLSDDTLDIRRALTTLPLIQRQVVVLHYICDVPVADVARGLGVSIGTVKSRLARGREKLAPLLKEEDSR